MAEGQRFTVMAVSKEDTEDWGLVTRVVLQVRGTANLDTIEVRDEVELRRTVSPA
jgi:hypothetical protein